jgi:hypothetical protein
MPDASRPVGDLTDDQIRKRLRVPVQEAAHLLGISPEAVRSRLYRGTLDKETGTDGTVYVRLHADQLRHDDEQTADQSQPNTELVGELRARVEDLREQLAEEREARRRADTIIAQLARANEEQARAIRELEAPSESPPDERESPETVEEGSERVEAPLRYGRGPGGHRASAAAQRVADTCREATLVDLRANMVIALSVTLPSFSRN